jgi:DNA-binding transcriptional regulator YiaG
MRSDLDKHIERHLRDKEFKIYFDRAEAKRKIAQEIAALRKAHNITQAQLAKMIRAWLILVEIIFAGSNRKSAI